MRFEELGPSVLCNDGAWFTPVVALSSTIKTIIGGWSRMLRDYLRLHLTTSGGLENAGVPLVLHGETALIWAKMGKLLSDGDGLRLAMEWLGAGSLKPCWRHNNVYKKDSDRAHRHAGYVEITCIDPCEFSKWDDDEFDLAIEVTVEAHRQHAEGRLEPARLEMIQQAYGFRATEGGLLADDGLRRSFRAQQVLRYDWPHTFLQDGIATCEAWLLVQASEQRGVTTQRAIYDFLKEPWVFPQHRRHQARALWRVFDAYHEKKNREHEGVKIQSSQLLTLYGLLRHFAEVRLGDDVRIADEIRCFGLLCKAVDYIMMAKHGVLTIERLETNSNQTTMRAVKQAFEGTGADITKQKRKHKERNTHAFTLANQKEHVCCR